jgi:SAM-dependent methyltransferase
MKGLKKKQLLIGCGTNKARLMRLEEGQDWEDLTTLDIDPGVKPDVVHDLNVFPYPFDADEFDEIHAYEVLEHCGRQGDYKYFFDQFNELWRILKPGGLLFASCPMWDSPWAWSDPGHTRVITRQSLIFLQLEEYHQLGKTHMTDYRHLLTGDWELMAGKEDTDIFSFCMRAKK